MNLLEPKDLLIARIFSKEETGLYYYGARYLDPKYSRWLSGYPVLGDYIPSPGTEPSKLAGMGGVYNIINLHLILYILKITIRDPMLPNSLMERKKQ